MREINTQAFLEDTFKVIDNVLEQQADNIREAGAICANAIKNGGVIQVFGTGHSVGFGMEMQGRPGSLVPVHTMNISDFVTSGMYTLEEFRDMDNIFERRPGVASKFYDLYEISDQDVFIIISNSGINGLVIDLAAAAKERNHKVIVVTSLDHTLNSDSRHPSGKKLMDFGDVVIDNCGPKGDAMLDLADGGKIGSVSSISGIYVAQGVALETIKNLQDLEELPVLVFEENEASKKQNDELKEKYRGRI